jgi:Protein of unknown function (DUF2950)
MIMSFRSRFLRRTAGEWTVAALMALSPMLLAASSSGQRTFATPQDAINALIHASEHNDTAALLHIFGPDGREIAASADPAEDKADREEFAALARKHLQIIADPANPDQVTFLIGAEDWPFPVPLVRENGKWAFDSAKGKVEVLAHRIGENELDTVDTCRAFVEAELEYSAARHDGSRVLQYAQRIVSSEGKQDGLYSRDRTTALVPLSFAKAVVSEQGNKNPEPYHGYYFRILKEQGPEAPGGAVNYMVDGKMIGGFALVAWPAEYGSTGIQTFIINHRGLVYGKDLGPDTAHVAAEMTAFDPDSSWHALESE